MMAEAFDNTARAPALYKEFGEHEMLQFLLAAGNMDIDDVASAMKKKELEKILRMHPYAISQGKDGRYRTYIRDRSTKGVRKQIAKATLEQLHTFLYDHYRELWLETGKERITLEKLYPAWLEYKALHVEAGTTIERIDRDWRKHYVGTPIIKRPLASLKKLDLDIWAHQLIKDNDLTKKSYYNITIIMRQVLQYAVDREIIEHNYFDGVRVDGKRLFRKEHKKEDLTQVFTHDELVKLEELAWRDFEQKRHTKHQLIPLAILFQFQTGVRLSELCAVQYGDIDGDEIWIRRMVRHPSGEVVEHTKGNSVDRRVFLTKKAQEIIAAAKKRREEYGLPVEQGTFIFSMTEAPMPYSAVNKDYYRFCVEIGTSPKTSHKARKTVISALVDGRVNINTIRAMMGHADERTTYKSYVFDRSDREEKARRIESALS